MDLLCEKCLTDLELVQSCCESSISEFLAHQLCGEGDFCVFTTSTALALVLTS